MLIAMQTSGPGVFIPFLGIVLGAEVLADTQEVPGFVIRRRHWPLAYIYTHFAGFSGFKQKLRSPVQMDGAHPGGLIEKLGTVQRALVNRKAHTIKVVFVRVTLFIIRYMPPDF